MSTLWVTTGTGKAIGLTEKLGRENYIAAEITKDMAEKGIPVEVPDTPFWRGKITEGLLKGVAENSEAKTKYDAWKKEHDTPKKKPIKKEEQE